MKILFIGLDGMRLDCLLSANTPNIKNLIDNSINSLDSKISTKTISGPSWACILSGRKEDKTKVYDNKTVEDNNYKWKTNNLFRQLNKLNVENKCFISYWNGMKNLVQDCPNTNFVKGKSFIMADKITIQNTINEIKKDNLDLNLDKSKFIFTYLDSIDETGHLYGYSTKSKKYMKQIEKIDKLLKPLIDLAKINNYNIFITTDHGGYTIYKNKNTKKKKIFYGNHSKKINSTSKTFQIYYGEGFKSGLGSIKYSKNIYKNLVSRF